jgi:hypothetical protein
MAAVGGVLQRARDEGGLGASPCAPPIAKCDSVPIGMDLHCVAGIHSQRLEAGAVQARASALTGKLEVFIREPSSEHLQSVVVACAAEIQFLDDPLLLLLCDGRRELLELDRKLLRALGWNRRFM